MKAFWNDLFYDMEECGLTKEEFAEKAGEDFRDELDRIYWAIKDHEPKKAFEVIQECKKGY